MTARKFFNGLAIVTLMASNLQSFWMRVTWCLFAIAFAYAGRRCKTIERAKWRASEYTRIEMKKEMLDGWEESLDKRYWDTTRYLADAFKASLSQLSTYVKDASPTRVAYRKLPDDQQ